MVRDRLPAFLHEASQVVPQHLTTAHLTKKMRASMPDDGEEITPGAGIIVILQANGSAMVEWGIHAGFHWSNQKVVVGPVVILGVSMTVGAAPVALQAERTTAAKQNDRKGFINMGTSRKNLFSNAVESPPYPKRLFDCVFPAMLKEFD